MSADDRIADDRIAGVSLAGVYRKAGEIYKVVAICERPTVTLENVKTGKQKNLAIGSRLFYEYEELIPKES